MEELAGGAGNQNVGVIAIGDCGECIGSLDACGTKSRAVKTDTNNGVTAEVLGKSTKRRRLSIDH
jgi:hypothetical protein